ncbi:CPW-WPC family protein, putative [Plasmodium ovale]|uniref:CPW-WPC family protein, putative n=2 Tax=Plasmodium ovale TaxID=36330 RepID=A0A1D3TKH3_PLAOA|nr:CPW-WPC family protein, putative [Plasmodium ovale]
MIGRVFMIAVLLAGWYGVWDGIFFTCFVQAKSDKMDGILSASGILKNVVHHSPKISESEINESEMKIVKKAHEEESKMFEKIAKCAKDYTLPCPKYWKKQNLNNAENLCIANKDYDGFCEIIQSFDNFSEHDKINFESSCNVEWDCKNVSTHSCESGKRNYNDPCPIGFITQNDNSCKADITVYKGMCNSHNNINFTHLTNSEKENWSIACEAYWPCYNECSSTEYLSNCPQKWVELNTYECIPDKSYTGPCKSKKSFKYFTKDMKIKFQEKCKANFVCKSECQKKNYEQEDCPLNWEKKNGYCLAPDSFNLCDRKKLSIEHLTINEKKIFEKECLVSWPCKENNFCDMNWKDECPLNWVKETNTQNLDKKKGGYSCTVDPSLYNGKCTNIYITEDADENTKREIASNCDTPWSCINGNDNPSPTVMFKPDDETKDGESENGPITHEGRVHKKGAFRVIEDAPGSSYADIMR